MPGKHSTLSQVKKALALRAAGLTRAAIADETGLSESTLSRLFRRHTAGKGAAVSRLVEQTQRELISRLSNDEALRLEAAKLMLEDMALNRLLREKLAETLVQLQTDDPDAAAVNLRALNSAASAMITAQKAARTAIGADRELISEPDLPVLRIEEMTGQEIAHLRHEQAQAVAALDDMEVNHG